MKRVILLLWICIVFSAGLITGNLPDSDQLIILRSLARVAEDEFRYDDAANFYRDAFVHCRHDISCKLRLYVELIGALDLVDPAVPTSEWCALYDSLRDAVESTLPGDPRWSDPDASSLPLLEGVSGGGAAVYLALHRAAEECGRYEEAWRYQSRGLEMKIKESSLHSKTLSKEFRFQDLVQSYQVYQAIRNIGSVGNTYRHPIFLVGFPRSVIDLITRILSNNDAIFGLPQRHRDAMKAVGTTFHARQAMSMFKTALPDVIDTVQAIMQKHSPNYEIIIKKLSKFLKDKAHEMVVNNFGMAQTLRPNSSGLFYYVEPVGMTSDAVGWINIMFPDAIIINAVCNPLDAFYATISEPEDPYLETPWTLSRYLTGLFTALSANVIEGMRRTLPLNRITDVSVSDLLEDPRSVLEGAVLRPLGLAWQEGMERGGGAGPMLARLRRLRGRARKYMQNGDISQYQALMNYFLEHSEASLGIENIEYPLFDSVEWDMGKQIEWDDDSCPQLDVEIPRNRHDLGSFLNNLGFKTGAELGVQQGLFSEITLGNWTNCEQYYLIDVWRKMDENYRDSANVDDNVQNMLYRETKQRLKKFEARTDLVYIRDLTSKAVHSIPDGSLDFVYIDARHDYCSVSEDLELYWPKLRPGGIMAGHDYMLGFNLHEIVSSHTEDRYDICPNGTIAARSVKGAADDFARRQGLGIAVTFRDMPPFLSFIMRKPCRDSSSSSSGASSRGVRRSGRRSEL